ncbi:MAG TPA: hypothetical protein PLX88_07240, partial [Syntrophorhabdaceae bacterium]|nr:hypothetical protein [Syntrophorhabdaceae bacterium]
MKGLGNRRRGREAKGSRIQGFEGSSEKSRGLEGWKVGGLAKNKKRRIQGFEESRVQVEKGRGLEGWKRQR